ncbi:MAG: helix-turn-helix transcriptional regulator [Succinivibrio sp.]|nr:helix-turn-helix transcriptional regulator [Succinivibrio sp.]
MTIRAYDEIYLSDAQKVLGQAVDFALLSLKIDADYFGSAFSVSAVSTQFEAGNPSYISGMNGCELAREVLTKVNITYPDIEDKMYLDKSPEYWAGWALAFYQWYSSRSFIEILNTVPLSEIIGMYPVFHEMDIMQFADRMDGIFKEKFPFTRLKYKRLNCNMSQSDLAAYSGVKLRQIQLFEQRQRNINKASAVTLLKLSRALSCRMEELMEF